MEMDDEQRTRFWSKVKKSGPIPEHMPHLGPCWIWIASKRNGYGAIKIDGLTQQAHRVSYIEANGPIGEGMLVCHHCDTPACVNPAHLFEGSHQDNQVDALSKGRGFVPMGTVFKVGHRPANRKLADSDAMALVRDVFAARGTWGGYKTVASFHNVPYQLVRDIAAGRSYIAVAKALTDKAGAADPCSNHGSSSTEIQSGAERLST